MPTEQLYERVYKDDNGGKGAQSTWGIGDAAISDVQWAPSKPQNQIVLRSTWKGYYSPYARIYRSSDAGKTWKGFDAPFPTSDKTPEAPKPAGAAKIAISSSDPNRMVYVRPNSVPVYTENGFDGENIEWKPSTGVNSMFRDIFPYYVSNLRLEADAADGNRFYFSVRGEKTGAWEIYVSDDGGKTWILPATQKLPQFPRDVILASVKGADGKGELWATSLQSGLYRSVDGARTFQKFAPSRIPFARAIAVGKAAPNSKNPTLYLAGTLDGRDGVFYSSDFGQNWTPMTTPEMPMIGGTSISDMVADGRDWGKLYIATGGTGALYSTVKR